MGALRRLTAIAPVLALLWAAAALAAGTAAELYQQGLTLETAKGDLEGAIAVYRQVVAEHPEDAAVAASAQLHVGLCYEKLGRQEARTAYERVIATYPGQTEVVERARERLQSLDQAREVRRPQAGAGPAKTREMMVALEKKRAGVQSYRGTMAATMVLMGQAIRLEGPVESRRPDLTRLEMAGPVPTGNSLTVSDGRTMWSWQRAANLVTRIDVAAVKAECPEYGMNNNAFQPFQGLEPDSIRYIRADQVGGEEVYVFQGKLTSLAARAGYGGAVPAWVELAVATRDGLLRRMVGYRDTGAEMMATEATIAELNPAIPDSAFTFTPPAGAQVMDMTETVKSLYARATAAAPSGPPAAPATGDAGAVIERLKAARAQVSTYRADQILQMSMMGGQMTQNVKEWYGGEDRSRRESTSSMQPGVTIAVQDSGTLWTYMPAMKMAQRMDMKRMEEAKQELRASEGSRPETYEGILRDSIAYVGSEILEGDAVEVLEGPAPKGQGLAAMTGMDLGRVRVWVGAVDGLIRRSVTQNQKGEEVIVQTRSNVEVNVEIPDSTFTFTPPEGVQVMDMTENALNMARQVQTRMREAAKKQE